MLPAGQGLNRFVWDLRYPTMAGVTGAHLEASYRGHKAPPGSYRFTFKLGGRSVTTEGEILANPLYDADAATYAEYHEFMSGMERELTTMHQTVNQLREVQERLTAVLAVLPVG